MEIALYPWLAVNIAPIVGLTISPGNAIPDIINTQHIKHLAVIDEHIIVRNTACRLVTVSTTTIKIINSFPAKFMPSQNAM